MWMTEEVPKISNSKRTRVGIVKKKYPDSVKAVKKTELEQRETKNYSSNLHK